MSPANGYLVQIMLYYKTMDRLWINILIVFLMAVVMGTGPAAAAERAAGLQQGAVAAAAPPGLEETGPTAPPETGEAALPLPDAGELKQAGLSDETIADLTDLQMAGGRKRPPVMTFAAAMSLAQAGLPDDTIRLLTGLDWLSGGLEQAPITPEQVIQLKKTGIASDTINLMLASEINLLAGQADPSPPATESAPGKEGKTQPVVGLEEEKLIETIPDPQGEIGPIKLGRQVVTRPDGKKVVVYSSPFNRNPVVLGRQEYVRPDGKKTIIYRTPFGEPREKQGRVVVNRPDGKKVVVYYSISGRDIQKEYDLQQRRELEKAFEILDHIHLHLHLPFPRRP